MKKLLFFLLLATLLSASPLQTEQKIYKSILHALFPHKETIYLWIDDPKRAPVFKKFQNIKIVHNKKDADILMLFENKKYKKREGEKLFANGYLSYKQNKENVLGAFYWQKGRPNLLFLKNNLKKANLKLPQNFQKYVED